MFSPRSRSRCSWPARRAYPGERASPQSPLVGRLFETSQVRRAQSCQVKLRARATPRCRSLSRISGWSRSATSMAAMSSVSSGSKYAAASPAVSGSAVPASRPPACRPPWLPARAGRSPRAVRHRRRRWRRSRAPAGRRRRRSRWSARGPAGARSHHAGDVARRPRMPPASTNVLAGGVRADQRGPGFEQAGKVLAGLEVADGEHVGARQGESSRAQAATSAGSSGRTGARPPRRSRRRVRRRRRAGLVRRRACRGRAR